jgi:dephospho-CoA kinase
MTNNLVIGLTGPIASGKNTVAKMFARRGAFVIDADRVGHQVIAPQSKAWHEIVKVFGSKVLNRGGAVNRRKLAVIVFSKPGLLKKLDKITHPEMRRIISAKIRLAKMSRKKYVVVNAALLKEMMLLPLVDKVLVVIAGKSSRIRRLIKKGRSMEESLAKIKAQRSDAEYVKMADIVIVNDKTIKDLKKIFVKVISKL